MSDFLLIVNIHMHYYAVVLISSISPHNVQILKLAIDVFNSGGDEKLAMPGLYPNLPRWTFHRVQIQWWNIYTHEYIQLHVQYVHCIYPNIKVYNMLDGSCDRHEVTSVSNSLDSLDFFIPH